MLSPRIQGIPLNSILNSVYCVSKGTTHQKTIFGFQNSTYKLQSSSYISRRTSTLKSKYYKYCSTTTKSSLQSCSIDSSKQPVLITTPIFYVNGSPHIGHLFSVLLADALARWHRILGHPTLFTTGTDEHGIKVQEAAEKQGKNVQQFCDEVAFTFRELWKKANISHDDYIRTTDERHKKAVIKLWRKMRENGDIFLGKFEGWYCVSDEAFLTKMQVTDELDAEGKKTGNKVSIETGNQVIWLEEENYQFKLSSWNDSILKWIIEDNPIYPPARSAEVVNDISCKAITDLSVSRLKSKLKWGIPVPDDDNHVIYVWVDALTNYLTVCGYQDWDTTATQDQPLKKFWPASYHIIGKDIAKFHSIYWPSFLLSAGLPLPRKIITHSHWTKDRKKISKSKGNIVEPSDLIAKFGVDPIRYFLLRQGGISHDGDYNEEEATNIIRDELANNLGNLVGRITSKSINPTLSWPSPVGIDSSSTVKQIPFNTMELDIIKRLQTLPQEIDSLYKNCEFGKAIIMISQLIVKVNLYLTDSAPWKLNPKFSADATMEIKIKEMERLDNDKKAKINTCLYLCLESVRISALLLQPVIPELSEMVLKHLGLAAAEIGKSLVPRNPFLVPFGFDYAKDSSLLHLTGDAFILFDDRAKKHEKLQNKMMRNKKM